MISNSCSPLVKAVVSTSRLKSPLKDDKEGFTKIDPKAEKEQINKLKNWRKKRNESKCILALKKLKELASQNKNIMEASIECAHIGVTTGEWTYTLRKIYGEYRAPTGVGKISKIEKRTHKKINERINKLSSKLKRRVKLLVGKPGLDGHSNGAEQIAMRAKEAGLDVVYQGIRLTPNQIVNSALEESVHLIGLSILSGSHLNILSEITSLLRKKNMQNIPVIVGGIIPEKDFKQLHKMGIKKVYTPKDFDLNQIVLDMSTFVEESIV